MSGSVPEGGQKNGAEAGGGLWGQGVAFGNTGDIPKYLLHVGGDHPGKEQAADDWGGLQMG